MGSNPLNFADTLLDVIAQRLLRKLCINCKEAYHPSEEAFEEIVKLYGNEFNDKIGISYTPELILYRSSECEKCNNTGYNGRIGIFEIMESTARLKKIIKSKPDTEKLLTQAKMDGMTTLVQDGISKVFQGLTDLKEVKRVAGSMIRK